MIILPKNTEITVRIPSNLEKLTGSTHTMYLTNTVTKKSYTIEFADISTNALFYKMVNTFTIPEGEYEYTLEGNTGLLRISSEKEITDFDLELTFKAYGD